jgi:hypothetical protein
MAVQLTDLQIANVLAERKPMPFDFQSRLQLRPKTGHKQRELEIVGAGGSEFEILYGKASLIRSTSRSFLGTQCQSRVHCLGSGGIMVVATSTRTGLRELRFMISTSTWLLNPIKKVAMLKIIMLKQRIDMPT